MNRTIKIAVLLASVWSLFLVPVAAAELDKSAVEFSAPGDIKWVRNAAGTMEQAVLFGDPAKPGMYVVRLKWLDPLVA